MKKEQMINIAEALDSMGEAFRCEFRWTTQIGENIYTITLADKPSCLELNARIPAYDLAERPVAWERKIASANRKLPCGTFVMEDGEIVYRLYNLCTDFDEVKSIESILAMIGRCENVLEEYAEEMLAPEPARSWLHKLNPLEIIFGEQ